MILMLYFIIFSQKYKYILIAQEMSTTFYTKPVTISTDMHIFFCCHFCWETYKEKAHAKANAEQRQLNNETQKPSLYFKIGQTSLKL